MFMWMWAAEATDDSLIPVLLRPPAEVYCLCELTDGDQNERDEWEPSESAQVSGRCEKIC